MNDRDVAIGGLLLLLLLWFRPKPQIHTSVSFVDDAGVTWYLQEQYGGNIWTDGAGHWWDSNTGQQWTATLTSPW